MTHRPKQKLSILLAMIILFLSLGQDVCAEDEIIIVDPEVEELIKLANQYAERRDYRSLRKQALNPLQKLARSAQENENYTKAIYIYRAMSNLYRKIYGETNIKTTRALSDLAYAYQLAGRFPEQIKILQTLLSNSEQAFGPGNFRALQYMKNLAYAYEASKALAKAEQIYQRMIEIYKEKGWTDKRPYQSLLDRLADIRVQQGDYARAEPALTQAMQIDPDKQVEVTSANLTKLYTYATILQVKGQYAEAEDLYKRMLAFTRKNPSFNQMPVATIYEHLGGLYFQIGAYEKSLEYRKLAMQGFKQKYAGSPVLLAYALSTIAESQLALGKNADALKNMQIVELIMSSQVKEKNKLYIDKNFTMPTLALAYSRDGQYQKAEDIFKTTLEELSRDYSPRHPLVTYAKGNLTDIYFSQNRLNEAEKFALETLTGAMASKSPLLLARAYFNLAKIRHKQSRQAEAIFFGKQGVNLIQSLRSGLSNTDKSLQKSFVGSQQKNYELLASWLIDAGRLAEAEQVLTMLKEEEYFNFIRRSSERNPKSTQAQLNTLESEQYDSLIKSSSLLLKYSKQLSALENTDPAARTKKDKNELSRLKRLVSAAENSFNQTLASITQRFNTGNNTAVPAQLESAGYDRLLQELGPNVALIHILPMDRNLRIILRTSSSTLARKIDVDHRTLNKAINDYRNAVKRPDIALAELFSLSGRLYQWLIKPVEKELVTSGIQTIMFYKNGVLRYVPLATLYDGKQFLIENYAIANYTAAARDAFDSNFYGDWKVAGMGVSKQHGEFAPLRMVPYELAHIVKQTDVDPNGVFRGQIYIDEAFTDKQFRSSLKGNFNVSHIATHFKFMPGTESDSFLLLGDGSHLSLGRLRTAKYDFKSIDLLTLSACETAVGNVASDGREIEGLATLVQRQGAKGVLATLWPVADCSTGVFMQHFYHYRQQGQNKAAALRHTQLDFIHGKVAAMRSSTDQKNCQVIPGEAGKAYQHPYFWAPFLLMGNWN